MNFRIEAARPQDCAVLVELIRALADYEKLAHLVQTTEEQVQAELFGPAPVIEALIGWEVARGGTRAVAFALYFHNYSTFLARRGLYLEDLFVVPEARRRGYGKVMMRHLARTAVARGCGRFEWSVLDWNQPAIDFYESLGAQVMADWRICRMTGEALAEFGRAAPPA